MPSQPLWVRVWNVPPFFCRFLFDIGTAALIERLGYKPSARTGHIAMENHGPVSQPSMRNREVTPPTGTDFRGAGIAPPGRRSSGLPFRESSV